MPAAFNLKLKNTKKIKWRRVETAMERATRKALTRFGFLVRARSQGSIKDSDRASRPGRPPNSHTGLLRDFIVYRYVHKDQSVLIGPAKTNQVFFNGDGEPVTGTVPAALEYGGQINILEREVTPGYWMRARLNSRRRLAQGRTRMRTVTIRPRPYMGPALDAERPGLASLWLNSLK